MFVVFFMVLESFFTGESALPVWVIVIATTWSLIWKGFALWRAAERKSVPWFIVLLVVNTLGILEILYLFLFSKIELPEVKEPGKKKVARRKKSVKKSKK